MKTVLYTGILIMGLVACRHQRAASSSSSDFSSQSSTTTTQTVDGNTTTTTTTTVSSGSTSTNTNSTDVSASGNDTNVTVVSAGGAADDTSRVYRLTVSFTSRGTGVDITAVEEFENWLNNYPKHPAFDKTQWGREGETSFCLKLKELSTREQEIFVRDVRTKLADKQLVFVDEYTECKGRKVN